MTSFDEEQVEQIVRDFYASEAFKTAHGKATKAGIERAKAKGTKFGGYREGAFRGNEDGHLGREASREKAYEQAEALAEIILPLKAEGLKSRAIAKVLTERRIPTPRGGLKPWNHMSVERVLKRLKELGLDR